MSGFLSPKFLRYRELLSSEAPIIDDDLHCRGCGYNLRMLKRGGRCPECGLDIPPPGQRGRIDVLCPEDPNERRRMLLGLRAATLGLAGMAACRIWLLLPIPGRDDLVIVDVMALIASLVWVLGVFLITNRTLDVYGPAMRSARLAVRITQVAWPISIAAALDLDLGGFAGGGAWSYTIWSIARVVGGLGLLVFLYLLAVPAYDAGCDSQSKWLITMFWGLLFATPLVGWMPRGISPSGAAWVVYGFLGIFVALWSILIGITVAQFMFLSLAAGSSSRDIRHRGRRDERIQETRDELNRDVESRIRRYPTE